MKIIKSTNFIINTIGSAIILIIVLFGVIRSLSVSGDVMYDLCGNIKAAFAAILFLLWMLAINRRTVSRLSKRYLLMTAGLELFWMIIRFIKFRFLSDVESIKTAWYLYYLPITMIPVLCLLLAISMGKPDNYKPKGFLWLFPLTALMLFALVMTNDSHSLVFIIPPGSEGLDVGVYGYGSGYYVIMVFVLLCALASFSIIFTKCRVPGSKKVRLLPLIPLMMIAASCAAYVMGIEYFFGFYKVDITISMCVLITVTLEMCAQCRLIPTNNGYDDFFGMSSIRSIITDEKFTPVISSDHYEETGDLRVAENSPVILENGYRLNCAPIKHGKVFWQDDLSELNAVLSELSATNDYLEGKNAAVRQMYEYWKKERSLIEKNRLYSRILSHTKPEIELYAELIEQLALESDAGREKALAVKAAFVGGYIKRRDNLVFLSEEGKPIDSSELFYCINELLSALELGKIDCSCSDSLEKPIAFERMSMLFEKFYRIIYGMIDSLSAVLVYLNETKGNARIDVRITLTENTPPTPTDDSITVRQEDGDWAVTIC